MSPNMRRFLPLVLAAVAAPALSAQSVFDSELRLAPQFLTYQIKSPSNETISELAIPAYVSIPFGPSFTMDVGTAFARARVSNGTAVSEISGLTDTQIRGNLTLGSDFLILTAGLNLPTGQSSVTLDQITAAGRIGNDFLAFPISNMGTGVAATAGVAVAQPLGDWNVGFGGALRKSQAYDPFSIPGQTLKFTPGNEYRVRVGLDRATNSGRVSFGLTYSAFANDDAGGSIYSTGNRIIGQTVLTSQIAGADVTFAGYDVFRQAGQYASGDPAGRENIANGYLGLGLKMFGTIVEPSFEARHWLQNVVASTGSSLPDRSQYSALGTVGLRTRLEAVGFAAYPSVGYTFGQLATLDAINNPVHALFTGFRAQLAIRVSQ
ncbi:MAG: hypothetical protein JWM95_782 [Gemmatimonadetes bacterium]|nr:hypothetical protein [Gemmatimonadota bacterium]